MKNKKSFKFGMNLPIKTKKSNDDSHFFRTSHKNHPKSIKMFIYLIASILLLVKVMRPLTFFFISFVSIFKLNFSSLKTKKSKQKSEASGKVAIQLISFSNLEDLNYNGNCCNGDNLILNNSSTPLCSKECNTLINICLDNYHRWLPPLITCATYVLFYIICSFI